MPQTRAHISVGIFIRASSFGFAAGGRRLTDNSHLVFIYTIAEMLFDPVFILVSPSWTPTDSDTCTDSQHPPQPPRALARWAQGTAI